MSFPFSYLTWHYSTAYQDITRVWVNYMWFVAHFFSLGIMLKTFFAPFKRLQEKNKAGLNVKKIFESLLINSLMRLVGMIMRTIVLSIGLVMLLITFSIGIIFYILWTIWPVFLLLLILFSLGVIKI